LDAKIAIRFKRSCNKSIEEIQNQRNDNAERSGLVVVVQQMDDPDAAREQVAKRKGIGKIIFNEVHSTKVQNIDIGQ